MTDRDKYYYEDYFESSDDFISDLRKSRELGFPKKPLQNFFRGQKDSTWNLMPSAWRPKNALNKIIDNTIIKIEGAIERNTYPIWSSIKHDSINYKGDPIISVAQSYAEYYSLWQFVELSNLLGLKLFGSEEILSPEHFLNHPKVNAKWPKFHIYQILGLAQHHGIPTRLLDFSTDPFIALWFAVDDAFNDMINNRLLMNKHLDLEEARDFEYSNRHIDKKLALWEINFRFIEKDSLIKSLLCPRSEHSYLHAQSGIFLFIEDADLFYLENGYWPSLDEIILEYAKKKYPHDRLILRKNIISVNCIPRLYLLLEKEGIFKSRLMPNFDNIANQITTSWL